MHSIVSLSIPGMYSSSYLIPKNNLPFQWVPVIAFAIAENELNICPLCSKRPSFLTSASCLTPFHNRTSRALPPEPVAKVFTQGLPSASSASSHLYDVA